MNNEPLLSVKNLRIEFKTDDSLFTALNGISFDISKGEVLGIVGESGSGKSVTALSIMRLLPQKTGIIREGEISFYKQSQKVNLLDLSEKQLRQYRGNEMGMVFQEPMTSLNPVYTCGNQVMEALLQHEKMNKTEAKKRTLALFEEVQLPRPEQIFDSYPHQLSGGQKQRIMIAMAISCNPALLIADEPTTALDVTVQKTILELIRRLQKERQMSVIFITHDLGVVAELADRVLVMYRGKIVEQGTLDQIFSHPQHPYTKGLLACRPPLTIQLSKLPGMSDFMQEDMNGVMISTGSTVAEVVTKNLKDQTKEAIRLESLYSQAPLLEASGLQTWFPIKKGLFGKNKGFVKAVDDVSLKVYPGEVLGLVGESGCGKTTLGRSILRLVDPTGGKVIYEGKNVLDLSNEEMRKMRKKMQIIFQDPYASLNPRITVGAAILEPMIVHKIGESNKERRKKVLELLDKVQLPGSVYTRYPHEFSGGQRQRICIARALSINPRFIICDESVSALDVSVQAQVLNLLQDLRTELGLTYIFISHDLSVINFIADRVIVMNGGKIEEEGLTSEILQNPKKAYTQKLISSIPGV